MKSIVRSIVGCLFTCAAALAVAAAAEGNEFAPEPTVSLGWVWFFLAVFVAICAWFGIAIWRADKKSRVEAEAIGTRRA
jgi:hypothetical protein